MPTLTKEIIEAAISGFVVGCWLLVVLMGAIRVLIGLKTHDKTRAEGGPAGYANSDSDSYTHHHPGDRSQHDGGAGAKFPRFDGPVSAVPSTAPWNVDDYGVVDHRGEKLGNVGSRSVGEGIKAGHVRASSYGYMEGKH